MKNPTMLYRSGSMLRTDSGDMDYIIVAESEIESHIKMGWYRLPSEMQEDAIADHAPTRAELEEKARELKIKFDGRTSDAKLAANIEAALNGLDKT